MDKKILDKYVPCRDTMPGFTIFRWVLDLRGFKNRDSSHEMFSNSTRFTHESRVPTKPWPMPPRCARDMSHAFWLARTQTPRIVRLHRWMLPDRTAILIPFDSTCSSGCNFIFMHKMHVNLKNVLKIANDTWNAPENQTRGIVVIAYSGNFYEAKRWSHRPLEFELTCLLLETMILHVWCSGLEGAIIKTCAKLYQFFPWGRESTPQAHIDFDDVWTPSEFPVIKIPTRPTPMAAPRSRNVWNFSPLLGQWVKTRKATHKWFAHLLC